MKQEQVIVGKFNNALEAEIAKGHLAAAGIDASILKDDGGGMFPSLQQTGGVQQEIELFRKLAAMRK
jgi:hypothetical protein